MCLQDETGLSNRSLVEIFANVHAVPAAFRQKLINQGGGCVAQRKKLTPS